MTTIEYRKLLRPIFSNQALTETRETARVPALIEYLSDI